jgi:hypothetical protein
LSVGGRSFAGPCPPVAVSFESRAGRALSNETATDGLMDRA